MKKTATIAAEEVRQSLKDKKVIVVALVYAMLLFLGIQKSVAIAAAFRMALIGIFGFMSSTPSYALTLFYFASIMLLPIFSLILAYDSISKEIHKGTIKKVAVAARRDSILLGKFAGIYLVNISINLMMYIFAAFYTFFKEGELALSDSLLLWIFLCIYALYFTSLAVLSSSMTSTPQKSIFLSMLLFAVPLIFLASRSISWLSPYSYYKQGLYILVDSSKMLLPSAILIVSSLLFILAAVFIFRRRDL